MNFFIVIAIFFVLIPFHCNGQPPILPRYLCDLTENLTEPLKINVKFYTFDSFSLDNDGVFNVYGSLGISWNDFYMCSWSVASEIWPMVAEKTQGALPLDYEHIWTPPIALANSYKDINVVDGNSYGTSVMTFFDGETQMWPTGLWRSRCILENIEKYPFDIEKCHLIFENRFPIELIEFDKSEIIINQTDMESGDEWILESFCTETRRHCLSHNIHGQNKTNCKSQAIFTFKLKRQSAFYTLSIFLPCFFLLVLQISTLCIPGHIPERFVFSILVLFTFLILNNEICQNQLPKTSHGLIVQGFLFVNFIFGIALTAYCTITLAIHEKLMAKKVESITDLIKIKEEHMKFARKIDEFVLIFSIFLVIIAYIAIFLKFFARNK